MEYDIFEAVAMSMGRQYQRAEEAEARRGGRGGAGAAEGSGRFVSPMLYYLCEVKLIRSGRNPIIRIR